MNAVLWGLIAAAAVCLMLWAYLRGTWNGYDRGFEDGYNQERHRRDKVVVRPMTSRTP